VSRDSHRYPTLPALGHRGRAFIVLALLSCGLSIAVGTAKAGNSQGDRYRGSGNDNGTRAYIAGSGSNNGFSSDDSEIVATVAVQIIPPSSTDGGYMMQMGEIATSAGSTSNCGTNVTAVFAGTETVINGNIIQYTCAKTATISPFGSGGEFDVVHISSGWEAFWNGNLFYGPAALGFGSGYSVARAEAQWGTAFPTYNMTWGPNNFPPQWQYKIGTGGYVEVGTSSGYNPSGDWHLGGTPSPMTIYFQ
jgi:hypothetical protein